MILFHNYSGAFEPAKPNRLVFAGPSEDFAAQIAKASEEMDAANKTSQETEDLFTAEGADKGKATEAATEGEAATEAKGESLFDKTAQPPTPEPVKRTPITTPEGPELQRPRVEKREKKIKGPAESSFEEYDREIEAKKRGGQLFADEATARKAQRDAEQAQREAEKAGEQEG